ncbi:hypothetical protein [Rhizobium sp. PL01]|uniref:hypothetical protein n=1 Tax=Rhizobium sp. PL01 TaxID=3085631 RepID=UPI002981E634|nr:hypothetical protein [Rhizobium sp. PL01]MDW5314984.1 hypothetical protein [Rhizobium sp. PL01]
MRKLNLMPEDPTPAMIKAALRIDWNHESELATLHEIWHAMYCAHLQDDCITDEFKPHDLRKVEPPAPAPNVVPPELCGLTFAVQHNPNCPSRWLVRLPGKSGVIDMKPYRDQIGIVPHQTGDVLGFGRTLDEAARAALAASEGSTDAV